MGYRTLLTALGIIVLLVTPARADLDQDGGGWIAFFARGSFAAASPRTANLLWWFDGQVRADGDAEGLSQTIVRPGIGWALTPETSLWVGYGWIRDYPPRQAGFNENRIWQQFLWAPRFGDLRFQSRTRLEERFLEGGSPVGWRLRELVKVVYPLVASERLFFAGYEEVFLNLNDTDWGPQAGFDQNRLFLGLSAPVGDRFVVELGYLNRYVYRAGRDGLMEHLASLNVFLTLD